jgi:hypothetical protein
MYSPGGGCHALGERRVDIQHSRRAYLAEFSASRRVTTIIKAGPVRPIPRFPLTMVNRSVFSRRSIYVEAWTVEGARESPGRSLPSAGRVSGSACRVAVRMANLHYVSTASGFRPAKIG